MSLFTDERYTWRETYFVFFKPERRPLLRDIRRELRSHAGTFRVLDEQSDASERLRALTIASYEDHSALEVSYKEGDAVTSEVQGLVETLGAVCTARERETLLRLTHFRAKFDVLHFEQTAGTEAFRVVKMPELRFALPKDSGKNSDRNARPRGRAPRFHFDIDDYQNCVCNGVSPDDERDGEDESDVGMDSAILERVDPNTLVLVLDVALHRLILAVGQPVFADLIRADLPCRRVRDMVDERTATRYADVYSRYSAQRHPKRFGFRDCPN